MKRIVIVAIILVVAFGIYKFYSGRDLGDDGRLTRAIGEYNCPTVSNLPDFGKLYDGPLIDTHMHIPHPPEGPEFLDSLPYSSPHPQLGRSITVSDYICNFKTTGITKAFIFFPVFRGLEDLHLAVADASVKRYPEFLVPFIMPPENDNDPSGFPTVSVDVLGEMLQVYSGLFRGYGEIGLYARGDNRGPTGAPELPPDSERLREIYPMIRENNLLVYFHLGRGQQESYERVLSANPDINFIFHGDQLIPYDRGVQNLNIIDGILSRHKNVYYGIDELYGDVWLLHPDKSKDQFFKHFENYEELLEYDIATWKGFIERHPDQVLWGTDRGVGNIWSMDRDVGLTLTRYARAFIALLEPSVQDRFAHLNAEALLLKSSNK
ncbi:MAG: hypothetical protein HYS87_02245 [Candidatus Colwellbacteria bacterium]|nr:hypothetical protein [Candidatus Colwellbacteria bacterium]